MLECDTLIGTEKTRGTFHQLPNWKICEECYGSDVTTFVKSDDVAEAHILISEQDFPLPGKRGSLIRFAWSKPIRHHFDTLDLPDEIAVPGKPLFE